jgi:hypothetical protein
VPQARHSSRVTDSSPEQTGQVEITSRAISPFDPRARGPLDAVLALQDWHYAMWSFYLSRLTCYFVTS